MEIYILQQTKTPDKIQTNLKKAIYFIVKKQQIINVNSWNI